MEPCPKSFCCCIPNYDPLNIKKTAIYYLLNEWMNTLEHLSTPCILHWCWHKCYIPFLSVVSIAPFISRLSVVVCFLIKALSFSTSIYLSISLPICIYLYMFLGLVCFCYRVSPSLISYGLPNSKYHLLYCTSLFP